jgi:hypothetical protein
MVLAIVEVTIFRQWRNRVQIRRREAGRYGSTA